MKITVPFDLQEGDTIDLLTEAEVADELGLSSARVYGMRREGKFPEPAATIGRSPVWFRRVIEAWAAEKEIATVTSLAERVEDPELIDVVIAQLQEKKKEIEETPTANHVEDEESKPAKK